MGNCPNICCLRNVKIVKDYPVQINNSIENSLYNSPYLTQPNYSLIIFLQTRIKRFLNSKIINTNEKLHANLLYNKPKNNLVNTSSNLNAINQSSANRIVNLRQQTTDKDELVDNNKNQNNIYLEEQKFFFQKIVLDKDANMFREDIFSKQNIKKNSKDPRNGPFDNKRKKFPILYQDNFSYEGEWKNGKRDGIGILIKNDVAKFIGEFIEDKANGFGKFINENGDEYLGYWKESLFHGLGIIYNKKKTISYKGWWKKDKLNGFGIEKRSKIEYVGEYINGNKEGYGVLYYRNGIYEGQMKDGNMHGIGCFSFNDKRKYEGEFIDNKMEGYGILSFPDGKIFIGSFIDDLEDGFGVFYTSKKIYIGFWQNMLLEGEVIVIEDEKKKKQMWEQGKCYKNLPQNYEIYFEKYVNEIIKQKDIYLK